MILNRLIAGLLLALPVAASAQGVFDMGALTNTLSMDANTQSERARAQRQGKPDPLAKSPAARPDTRFTPSPAVRKRVFATIVAKTRAVDPKAADELQKMFAARDPIAGIERDLAPMGLRTNDALDATTTYLTTAWFATRGRDDTPSRAQINGVRNQLARSIGPTIAASSPAAKQELSDVMFVQAMLVAQSATAAKATPALREKVAAATAQGARATFGFDLRKMSLTAAGLRPLG
ncbi:DUF6683 family protein [Glacieibacterium frigidum]|uniref:DUF305 domain-containing protein n=1 Tax=Glacieibacterium frigidum TaxID=2593303 RepID=A0A552UGJ3_9SPHN|nr:DUF6683 family protein [Glacieibacterium frigidum]TRW17353.1 hypothetical protein FMM06_04040 [Glacieibacterium frigidum]